MIEEGLDQTPHGKTAYTRAEFSSFFRAKYLRLLSAALNRNERRPRYGTPEVIEQIVAPYRRFAASTVPVDPSPIPAHIWMLWQQGWDSAPPLVAACARSWKEMNPGWQVHLVDDRSIADFAPSYGDVIAPKASRMAQSDIARLCLLGENGGVWADASLFCQQPLDDWLPKVMDAGFFMFAEPRPYRYSDVWFLASARHTILMGAWLEMVKQYWQYFKRPHHYYWLVYLFELLAARDPRVGDVWRSVPRLSALGPLIVQGLPFEKDVPTATISMIEQGIIPVHKLSHKWRFSGPLKNTPVGLLTGLERLRERSTPYTKRSNP